MLFPFAGIYQLEILESSFPLLLQKVKLLLPPIFYFFLEFACNEGVIGDAGLIPGLERNPGGGHGNPLQYSCLENPMDRGVWWATVHRVAKSRSRMKQLSTHAQLSLKWPLVSSIFSLLIYHLY